MKPQRLLKGQGKLGSNSESSYIECLAASSILFLFFKCGIIGAMQSFCYYPNDSIMPAMQTFAKS